MKELFKALELRERYNLMKLEDCIIEFEKYTNQKVPKKAIEEFKFVGLNNVDFLTSDWLTEYGLKNLIQFESKL